jgi:hypothetical protein
MKELFYFIVTIVIVLGTILFGADRYAKYYAQQKVMSVFNDDGTKDIDYEVEKIGPLMYKCTGSANCLGVKYKSYTYVAGFDTSGLYNSDDDLFD